MNMTTFKKWIDALEKNPNAFDKEMDAIQQSIFSAFQLPTTELSERDINDAMSIAVNRAGEPEFSWPTSPIQCYPPANIHDIQHTDPGHMILDLTEVTTPLRHYYVITPTALRDLWYDNLTQSEAEKSIAFTIKDELMGTIPLFPGKHFLIDISVFDAVFKPLSKIEGITLRIIDHKYFSEFHNETWQRLNQVYPGAY